MTRTMPPVTVLVPVLVALALLAGFIGLYVLQSGRRRIAARLEHVRRGAEGGVALESFERPLPPLVRLVGLVGYVLPGHLGSEMLLWELARAGYRHPDARSVFAGSRVLSVLAFLGATIVVGTVMHLRLDELLFAGGAGAVAGFVAPMAWIRALQARRRSAITLSLPDALDLMVICVEAGQGLNAALQSVARESGVYAPALAGELRMVNHEMRAGLTRAAALRNLSMRTGVDDVRALVAVLIQSDRFGTSIAQTLRTHAQSLRIRRRQRAEEAARKTPVKMVFPLVFCIFPELLVVILAPGMIQMYRALISTAGN